MRNQTQIRKESLKALMKFEQLNFELKVNENGDKIQGDLIKCDIIKILHDFEQLNISFETEKAKLLHLQ